MELSNVQKKVLDSNENLVITAGAGSGKTRVLVEKYLSIFENAYRSVDPLRIDQVVAITFTEKAAREMRERIMAGIEERIKNGEKDPYSKMKYEMPFARISTIHSFCVRLIRESALYVDLDPDFKIISGLSASRRISKIVESYMIENIKEIRKFFEIDLKIKFSDVRKWLEEAISSRWQDGYVPEDIDEKLVNLYRKNAMELVKIYREAAIDESILDFEDLLIFTRDLLRKYEELRHRYSEYFRYIFVDEFQDTNALQSEIVDLLRSNINKIWYIGDPKQSIYAFRGADVEVFIDTIENAKSKNISVKELGENHRSAPNLVEFYNRFFPEVFKDGKITYSPQIKAAKEDKTRRVILLNNSGGSKVDDARQKEAEAIAKFIQEMNSNGRPFSDIVILLRGISDVWTIENELVEFEIPYHIIGGKSFFDKKEILALNDLVSVILDPYDNRAMTGLLLSAFFGLSLDEILYLKGKNSKIYEKMRENEKYVKIIDLIDRLIALKNTIDVSKLLKIAVLETNYLAKLANQKDGDKKIANVMKFIETLDTLDIPSWDISSIQKIMGNAGDDEGEEASALSETENVVKIMTIHKSKGLEFPVVIIAQMGKETKQKGKVQSELDEEKRILYVAMTRAKETLVLSRERPDRQKSTLWLNIFAMKGFFGDKGWEIPKGMEDLVEIVDMKDIQKKNSIKKESIFKIDEKYLEKVSPMPVRKVYNVTELFDGTEDLDPKTALYGTVAHEILEMLGNGLSLEEILSGDFFTTYPVGIVEEVKKVLRGLVEDPLIYEIRKSRDVKSEMAVEVNIGQPGLQLIGKIDKVIQTDGGWKIIDFKYSRYSEEKIADYEFQVKLYIFSYEKLTGRKASGTIFFLKDAKKLDVLEYSPQELISEINERLVAQRQDCC